MDNKAKILISVSGIILLCLSCGEDGSWRNIFTSKLRTEKSPTTLINELKEKIVQEEKKKGGKDSEKDLASLYDQLGTKYLEVSNWSKAIENLEKSIKLGNSTPVSHYSLGIAYANRGKDLAMVEDFNTAERQYIQSLKLRSEDNMAAYGLSLMLFYHMEQKERGVAIMETFTAKNRKHLSSRFALARMYYEMDQPQKSLAIYEELQSVLQKYPDSKMAREYKEACQENIRRITSELSRQ